MGSKHGRRVHSENGNTGNVSSYAAQFFSSPQRTGTIIASAFVLAGVASAAGGQSATSQQNSAAHANSGADSIVEMEVVPNTAAASTSSASSVSEALSPQPEPAPTTSTSSSVTSSSINGETSTKVVVNGQDVPVPSNQSSQQTIIGPDGSHTTVNVSHSSHGTGTSINSSFSNTNLHNMSSSFQQGGTNP